MTELLNTVRGAAALDIGTFVRFRDREDAFRRGVTILVLVALVVGMVAYAVDLVGGLINPPFEREMAEIQGGIEQWLQFAPQYMDPELLEGFKEYFLPNFEAGMEIARKITTLRTPLPKGVSLFFETLGDWVQRPLAMLGGFLGYGIWVMLAAKLLGGKGRLQEFLGTAALSAVPYLLLILERLPCLGSILGVVAWVWGAIIWVVATAVTHGWAAPQTTEEGVVERYEVNWGKAILAVILPALAVAVLVIIGAAGLGSMLAAIIRAAG